MAQRITIIGGGPGGYTAAFEAAEAGAEVTLVEAAHMGGTCLNWGCIPTKAFKTSAEALETAQRLNEFGIVGQCDVAADMAAIVARKDRIVATLRGGLEKTRAKLKIAFVSGRAQVVNAQLVRVQTNEGELREIPGDKVIIATGSSDAHLPELPVDHATILTSEDILQLEYVPQRLLVVGGGIIGSEMACIFHGFGSRVTIVEGKERILPLPSIDGDISKLVQREMKKRKIACELARTVVASDMTASGVAVTLGPSPFLESVPASAQKEKVVEADAVLLAVGRVPNTAGLGLAEAGIETDQQGWIVADASCQTSQPGIYAIGDVLGPEKGMLAHVAAMEGLVAAGNCLGREERMAYDAVPAAVFTSPEVAAVGLTQEQAEKQGYSVTCTQRQVRELGKAQAMGALPGLFKLVVDAHSGTLLGAHLAGAHVSDIIAEPTLALSLGATGKDIARTIHAHPTLAEGVFEAARDL